MLLRLKPSPPPPVGPPPWISPLLDASGGQAFTMAAAALCSLAASVAIYLVTLALASRLNAWQRLLPWQRVAFAADAVSLAHAVVVTPLGVLALDALRRHETASFDCGAGGWGSANLATAPSPDVLVVACGISCGTFVFDCILLLAYPAECAVRFAAAGGSWIMWLHHTVSIVVWPYCVLTSRAAVFVAWMIATEASNIGQNSYSLAGAAGYEGNPIHLLLGIGWLLSFLVFRIIPAPVVVVGYVRLFVAQDCGLSRVGRAVGLLTLPIPLMMNAAWFWEMLKGAVQALGLGKQTAGKKQP